MAGSDEGEWEALPGTPRPRVDPATLAAGAHDRHRARLLAAAAFHAHAAEALPTTALGVMHALGQGLGIPGACVAPASAGTAGSHASPPAGPFFLSELAFFLRFFQGEQGEQGEEEAPTTDGDAVAAPTTPATPEPFFGLPRRGSSYRDAYDTYLDVYGGPRAVGAAASAWALLMHSKLEDMTACGHFVDTVLRSVYFPSTRAAGAASAVEAPVAAINGLRLRERPAALLELLAARPASSFCVRVEVDDSHVYLLDIPATTVGGLEDGVRSFWRLESILGTCDVRPSLLGKGVGGAVPASFSALLHRLADPTRACDCFTVREYAGEAARARVVAAVTACFRGDALAARVPHGGSATGSMAFEAGALELVYRLNAAAGVEGLGVWLRFPEFLVVAPEPGAEE